MTTHALGACETGTSRHAVHVLDYHPDFLEYELHAVDYDGPAHPDDATGSPDRAVGVHSTLSMGPGRGALLWHECTLSNWTATRSAFAAEPATVRDRAVRVGPSWAGGKWGTHLGATMAVVTADDHTVLRSRAGKYAEEHLYDSLVAGTMLMADYTPTVSVYLRKLTAAAGIHPGTVSEFHPTHLAMRTADFGLWVGGWLRTDLTAAEVAAAAPFDTLAVPLEDEPTVPLTDWGSYDLDALRCHAAGHLAHHYAYLP